MTAREIHQIIMGSFGENAITGMDFEVLQPWLEISPDKLSGICLFLRDDSRMYFDFLQCLTGIDKGPDENRIGVVYHLCSIPFGHRIVLKCFTSRTPLAGKSLPEIPSVSSVWKTADWHEREAYDLFGIKFTDHPDLRRILLPEDWEGHPLRKDYQTSEEYHGVQIDY